MGGDGAKVSAEDGLDAAALAYTHSEFLQPAEGCASPAKSEEEKALGRLRAVRRAHLLAAAIRAGVREVGGGMLRSCVELAPWSVPGEPVPCVMGSDEHREWEAGGYAHREHDCGGGGVWHTRTVIALGARLRPAADVADSGALLFRLWSELDQEGRDELALHAEALSKGGAWVPLPSPPEQGWLELRGALNGGQRDEVAAHALALLQGEPWPMAPHEERARLFAEQPPTAREPAQRLGDSEEEIADAEEWTRLWCPTTGREFAREVVRGGSATGARLRGLAGRYRERAAELFARAAELDAAQGKGSWARPADDYPPGPSHAPTETAPHERDPACPEHGVATPDSFPGSDYEAPTPPRCSCPGGAS